MRNVLSLCGLYTLGETPRQAVRGIADRVLHGLSRRKAVSAPMRFRGVELCRTRRQISAFVTSLGVQNPGYSGRTSNIDPPLTPTL